MEPTTNERITATAATDTAVSEQETLELQAERLIIGAMADRISQLEQALETALNTETAARIGSESGAMQGFDYKYHYDKIRTALEAAK